MTTEPVPAPPGLTRRQILFGGAGAVVAAGVGLSLAGPGRGLLDVLPFVGGGAQGTQGCAQNDLPAPPICEGPAGQWPPPSPGSIPGCNPADPSNAGNVWGYFVTAVLRVPHGTDSEERCAFNELGTCVAVLVE